MPLELTAIVAMADNNRGIGLRNHLPWSVPEDWNYFLDFVRTTRDPSKVNALLMGRKTFESVPEMGLGTSLSPCLNVVITSRDLGDLKDPHVFTVSSFNAGLTLLNEKFSDRVEKIILCGGSRVYREGFQMAPEAFSTLYLTRIFGQFECDVFLEPENFLDRFERLEDGDLDGIVAKMTSRTRSDFNRVKSDPLNGIQYIFEVYRKVY